MIHRPHEPMAMNKTILQDDHQLPSYPSALLNPYHRYSHQAPHAPVFTPNGVLTTTPYKTVAKDYGMEYARLNKPINTIVTEHMTATKRNRQQMVFKDIPPKDNIIRDTPTADIEVNPDETRNLTKSDKNFLNTPDAVNMKYIIDPSEEMMTRNKQPFRYIGPEYNNMLPDYLQNQESNFRRKKDDKNKTREKFSNEYSRNEAYARMWMNHGNQNKLFSRFDSIDEDIKEGFNFTTEPKLLYPEKFGDKNIQQDIESYNKIKDPNRVKQTYEVYDAKTSTIKNKDMLEEIQTDADIQQATQQVNRNQTQIVNQNVNMIGNINASQQVNTNETFEGSTNYTTGVENYLSVLRSQATALLCFVKQNKDFQPWARYWDYLDENLHKQNKKMLLFQQLETSDADVAYVQNKGEKMRFRIRDSQRFVPISIYTYVLIHEMAHLANGEEWGHGPNFQMLMHLLEVAGYEIGILKVKDYPEQPYYSESIQILTKESIKHELYHGIETIINNGGHEKFYTDMMNKIMNS